MAWLSASTRVDCFVAQAVFIWLDLSIILAVTSFPWLLENKITHTGWGFFQISMNGNIVQLYI